MNAAARIAGLHSSVVPAAVQGIRHGVGTDVKSIIVPKKHLGRLSLYHTLLDC